MSPPPLSVQRRALATYIRRLYYPYLLHEPEVQALQGGALAAGASPTDSAVSLDACCCVGLESWPQRRPA